jgi:putative DNA primase/helicase
MTEGKSDNIIKLTRAFQEGAGEEELDRLRSGAEEEVREVVAKSERDASWTEPEDLPDIPPAPPLPADPVPLKLDEWVRDISRCANTPLDYPVSAAWVAAGAAIGRRVGLMVCPSDNFIVIPNLWGGVIGDPSQRKSTPLSAVFKPLQALEVEESLDYESKEIDRVAAEGLLRVLKNKLGKKREKGQLSEEDRNEYANAQSDLREAKRQTRYVGTDPTVPKLGEMLLDNPNGILLHRDELAGFFASLGESGREQDRAFYLTAWNGDKNYIWDRIERGTKLIENTCVSIFGSIQPGVLGSIIRGAQKGAEGNDGLLQRFQVLVYPEKMRTYKRPTKPPNTEALKAATEAFRTLVGITKLEGSMTRLGGSIPFLQFSRDAQALYYEWSDALQQELRTSDMHPTMMAHLAKYASLMPSLALIDHVVDVGRGPVGVVSVQKAIRMCVYYRGHAERIFAPQTAVDLNVARLILPKITSGAVAKRSGSPERFVPRDIYRAGWSGLDDKSQVEAGLQCLEEHGYVQIEERRRGQKVVYINPAIV